MMSKAGRHPGADAHEELLMELIAGSGGGAKLEEDALKDYLCAFSYYLCNADPAYTYNLSYLQQQHEKFRRFLKSSQKKLDLVGRIDALLAERPEVAAKIPSFELNGFLEKKKGLPARFAREPSFSGGERPGEADVLRVQCEAQALCIPIGADECGDHSDADIELALQKIFDLIEQTNPQEDGHEEQ